MRSIYPLLVALLLTQTPFVRADEFNSAPYVTDNSDPCGPLAMLLAHSEAAAKKAHNTQVEYDRVKKQLDHSIGKTAVGATLMIVVPILIYKFLTKEVPAVSFGAGNDLIIGGAIGGVASVGVGGVLVLNAFSIGPYIKEVKAAKAEHARTEAIAKKEMAKYSEALKACEAEYPQYRTQN